ncbi:3-keto-disaccharide hydrolase [Pedobacter sp. SAFR-022]|uniref:3-keto-disaccharide hydrolase n=1 Tax=Pedobacter sp. SAFR-022 TaxID=3436861 RepID=UPI003F810882
MADNPFIASDAPVKLKMRARKIPGWGISYSKVAAFDVPVSPVVSDAPMEEITLVPFGSENIRLSLFPVVGTPGKRNKTIAENFKKGMPEGWVFYGGGWFWKDGAIHSASNAGSGSYGIDGSKIVANATEFSDLEYEASLELTSPGDAGMIFRVTKPAIGANAYQGYYVGLNPETGLVTLGKANGYTWQVISSKEANLKQHQQYRLKVRAQGNSLKVFLDGASMPIISVKDEEFKSGSIGLRAYKAQAAFDQLKVKAI